MLQRIFWARPITTKSNFFELCLKGEESLTIDQSQIRSLKAQTLNFELKVRELIEQKCFTLIDSGSLDLMLAAKAYAENEDKHSIHFYRSIARQCDAILLTPFPVWGEVGQTVNAYGVGCGVAFEVEKKLEDCPETPAFILPFGDSDLLTIDWANKQVENGGSIQILTREETKNALSCYGYKSTSK